MVSVGKPSFCVIIDKTGECTDSNGDLRISKGVRWRHVDSKSRDGTPNNA